MLLGSGQEQCCSCFVLFQMGKFYELFHMDAAIAVNELGLIYMKVSPDGCESTENDCKDSHLVI